MSLISIGLSGLNASSAAISTIGNNTANVDTAGYSRQQVLTTASAQQNLGGGYVGTGTTLSDVRRIYNSFLDSQLQTSTSLSSEAASYSGQASKTDKLLSDSSTGVSAALAQFFTLMQGVSTAATNSNARQLFLSQASALTSRFNSVSSQLTSQNSSVNSQLMTMTSQVNKLSSSIASLNQQITSSTATGATPNTLLDSRSEAVRQLNELVGAKVVESNGNFDVYIGTGQSLVSGSRAYSLSASPSSEDPLQYNVKLEYALTTTDVSSALSGGSIGGLLNYRKEVLTPSINEIGRVAMVLSDQVNAQMNQGIDANGAFGTNLFSSINDPGQISQRSIGNASNTGSGNFNVTITDSSKLTASDYEVAVDKTNPNLFKLRSLPEGREVGSGDFTVASSLTFADLGFKISPTGTAGAGDSFKLTPTRNAAAALSTVITDPRSVAAAAPLTASASASNTGTGKFTQPEIITQANIYDTASTQALQGAIKDSTPLKLSFGAVSGGSQSYQLLDAKGNAVMKADGVTPVTGSIVPGQSNQLNLEVGYGSGQAYTVQMTISGAPSNKDAYNIDLTGAGSSDNRNAIAALSLQTKQTVGVNGSAGQSMSGAYGSLVSTVGSFAAQGITDTTATSALLTQSKNARDAVSGVSLDEEAANLIKYQQYYTASSQIIKAAQTIFSTLINSL
ncbi:flagellar hook-associated protein FlgK [Pseudomonas sp. CDFA 602]|uniref:flagellar hook-associated protein FlgK n=1 Tax=Pseudomonas californiensis TaxID=2829823 RepID=UPI001E3D99D7|nr:flagellar hook-associated protein FlgK [Pseudomonas californiensis]MCD5992974.1 flagellar hook-associated protein FlgK [Pseudomonas californiensis]MCD5998351.1 flagellar hook-associated protein FlgK [Pseudomonas californiensis]